MGNTFDRLGRTAMLIALAEPEEGEELIRQARVAGYQVAPGRVGTMEVQKLVAAVETAARREGLIDGRYCSQHALYHAIIDAVHGLVRGQLELGEIMRTIGVRFAAVKGMHRH